MENVLGLLMRRRGGVSQPQLVDCPDNPTFEAHLLCTLCRFDGA